MLAELHGEISRQGGYEDGAYAEPVVSLELFFDGNEDPGSIGCNLSDHPGPDGFYRVLSAIRDRPDVYGVWVGISEVMDPDEWPFSDHIYFVTTASCGRGQVVGSRAESGRARRRLVERSTSTAAHRGSTSGAPGYPLVGLAGSVAS